jgi:hypothetical protein
MSQLECIGAGQKSEAHGQKGPEAPVEVPALP